MKSTLCVALFGLVAVVLVVGPASTTRAQGLIEEGIEARWYLSPHIGQINFEGDEALEDGFLLGCRLGYHYNEWWSVEGVLFLAPSLDENFSGTEFVEDGRTVRSRRSQIDGSVENPPGSGIWVPPEGRSTSEAGFGDTHALGLAADLLFHFTPWERLDPYLAGGLGVTLYGEDVDGGAELALRVGGGVMYHFNDAWALRGDVRTFLAGSDTEANAIIDAGVVWTWGAYVPPMMTAVDGPRDSDGDDLTDGREREIGTDPYNPDSDWDGLKDGEEVSTYRTDPLKRDTDGGGVADGHEVIEDQTNPLDPSDDLILFELNIRFDTDRAVIKPAYFHGLDVVAKVLRRDPEATARIEGHADRRSSSSDSHNMALSRRRAQAVLDYLAARGGIERSRMEAHGYGFSRPKARNDPKRGNPVNRRVEVYIRGSEAGRPAGRAAAGGAVFAPDRK